jgi:hypothetical protein
MKIEGVKKAKIVAGASRGKLSIMEVWLFDEKEEILGTKYINVAELKEKNIIKRANQFKKAEEWLNTEEGLSWVSEAKHWEIF